MKVKKTGKTTDTLERERERERERAIFNTNRL